VAAIPDGSASRQSEDWLTAHNKIPAAQSGETEKARFERFLVDKPVPGAAGPEVLFRQFLEWQKRTRPSP